MPRSKNLEGKKFGFLSVLKDSGEKSSNRSIKWECLCICGKKIFVETSTLLTKNQKSCGCKTARNPVTKHGHSKNKTASKTYNSWANMHQRCGNPNHPKYKNYGGRGITVCKEWSSFNSFLFDMGEKPEGMTIERIDVNKGYSKENCKWASHKEQANNKTCTEILSFNGEKMTAAQWAEYLGIKFSTLRMRLYRNWPLERALK